MKAVSTKRTKCKSVEHATLVLKSDSTSVRSRSLVLDDPCCDLSLMRESFRPRSGSSDRVVDVGIAMVFHSVDSPSAFEMFFAVHGLCAHTGYH